MRFSLLATFMVTGLSGLALATDHHGHMRQRRAPILKAAKEPAPTPAPGQPGQTTVTVQKGDTLGKFAHDFNTGICDIAKLNNIADPNFLAIGQVLQIPTNVAKPDNTTCLPPATTPFVPTPTETPGANGLLLHTVVKGDTLTSLAKRFNTGICNIAKASGLADPNKLDVGQVLKIPFNTAPDNSSCLPPTPVASPAPKKTGANKV